MSDKQNGSVHRMPGTPIIGQRFLDQDIPAEFRRVPEGVALPLAGLMQYDKAQLDRIEAMLLEAKEADRRLEIKVDALVSKLDTLMQAAGKLLPELRNKG